MKRTVGRLVGGWLVAVAATAAVTRVGVTLPERCGSPTSTALTTSVDEAVGWFAHNQNRDGTFRYRVDTRTGVDEDAGYSWVRHAGVLLSLEQAASAGVSGAREVADRAWPAAEAHLRRYGDRLALLEDGTPTTGGTALLVAALAQRQADAPASPELEGLGRFVAGQVEAGGRVDEEADPGTGARLDGTPSPFTTGEAMFALSRLERLFPSQPWDAFALRIGDYMATDRADQEGFVPDASDHWGAYAVAEMVEWPGGPTAVPPALLTWVRRQMGVVGIQVRVEAQRAGGGWVRLVRGHDALASGVGTLGEALAAWERVAHVEPSLLPQSRWLAERRSCVDDLLIDRQVTPQDAASRPPAALDAARGSFEGDGVTQMDDTQHALSALVAGTALAEGPDRDLDLLPRRAPVPRSALLVVLAALAATAPLTMARRRPRPEDRGGRDRAPWPGTGTTARQGPGSQPEAAGDLPAAHPLMPAGGGADPVTAPGPAPTRPRFAPAIPAAGLVAGVAVLAALAAAGPSILRALDVSAGTALLAAGLAVAIAGATRSAVLVWRRPQDQGPLTTDAGPWWQRAAVPWAVPWLLRPSLLLLALATGAGGRGAPFVLGAGLGALVALLAAWLLGRRPAPGDRSAAVCGWAELVVAGVALATGVALIVEGVYAI